MVARAAPLSLLVTCQSQAEQILKKQPELTRGNPDPAYQAHIYKSNLEIKNGCMPTNQ
jgi:hypothetical protein